MFSILIIQFSNKTYYLILLTFVIENDCCGLKYTKHLFLFTYTPTQHVKPKLPTFYSKKKKLSDADFHFTQIFL